MQKDQTHNEKRNFLEKYPYTSTLHTKLNWYLQFNQKKMHKNMKRSLSFRGIFFYKNLDSNRYGMHRKFISSKGKKHKLVFIIQMSTFITAILTHKF